MYGYYANIFVYTCMLLWLSFYYYIFLFAEQISRRKKNEKKNFNGLWKFWKTHLFMMYIIYYISTVLLKRIIIKYCIFTYCVHIHMQVYFLLLFLFFLCKAEIDNTIHSAQWCDESGLTMYDKYLHTLLALYILVKNINVYVERLYYKHVLYLF